MDKKVDFGFRVNDEILLPEIDAENKFRIAGIFMGSMGICVKIVNVKTGETFALKGMQENIALQDNSQKRFLKEMSIWLAASSYDGVVTAFNFVHYNGCLYMMAQWIDGGDLRSRMNSLTPQMKLKVFVEVVDTLRAIHAKFGIIHRDLKPENILIGSNNRGLLSDFGLANSMMVENGETEIISNHIKTTDEVIDFRLTCTSICLGTITYMSPEQISDTASADFQSDIYSLGCILFELETGHPPFISNDLRLILLSHLVKPPEKLGGFFKKTNLGVETVIDRCLKKHKSDRYQSYDELLKELLFYAKKRFLDFEYNRCIESQEKHYLIGKSYSTLISVLNNTQSPPNCQIIQMIYGNLY